MYSPKKNLETPSDFNFPFTPYKIQEDLMQALYEVIENKEIGIFESPTGTGKSLTLTCSALKWLLDHENLVKEEINVKIVELSKEIKDLEESEAGSDWIQTQFESIQKKKESFSLEKLKTLIEQYQEKMRELKDNKKDSSKSVYNPTKKSIVPSVLEVEDDNSFEDFDQETNEDFEEKDDNEVVYKDIKIYFCSRTHSQLSQVVREIKRSPYGKEIRCVSLASRQNLCINPAVRRLGSVGIMNEKCLEMQRSQSKTTLSEIDGETSKKMRLNQIRSCPFKNQSTINELRESSLINIMDIEDLFAAGEVHKTCPYYASRASIKDAQIIMLPYQMLLHKQTRLQAGIDLRKSIVIIDEAHNLLDSISAMYSNEISRFQLETALSQISAYKSKYFNRFKTENLLKINQLIFVIKRLIKLILDVESDTRMMKTHELMSEGEFFNIDLFKIFEFCEGIRFAQKVHALAQKMSKEPVEKENKVCSRTNLLKKLEEQTSSKSRSKVKHQAVIATDEEIKQSNCTCTDDAPSVIRPLLLFLQSLTTCPEEGMVLLKGNQDNKKATMKFILLDPGGHFQDLVQECRSIIIAGGTMQPVSDLVNQLFKSSLDRIQLHFFDHIITSNEVLPVAIQKGPTGKKFLFNFSNRNNEEMLMELGMTLLNVCSVVPAGIVCFFSSYEYLDLVLAHLEKQSIMSKITTKKRLFRETRSSGDKTTEKMLTEYATTIQNGIGAILFSVVGGKLSEGLNFADDLGRCVIVVGLPYPNRTSPELQSKMKYLDQVVGDAAGNEYYENLCIKAVNQCIGRSVRHIKDYACVLLLDERYGSERVAKKLPTWISKSLKTSNSFGMVQASIARFFRDKRNANI